MKIYFIIILCAIKFLYRESHKNIRFKVNKYLNKKNIYSNQNVAAYENIYSYSKDLLIVILVAAIIIL
ncbi:MAG: hypothetical protein N4A33_00190 [Bacteriovoracaceae bacterium]|nr:hypothetical protein [Bacteriovoracaceae bacterium]